LQRRLSAILAADVVGYSRLMGLDEAGTLAALNAHRVELLDAAIAEHEGRIVKLVGDGVLAEFASIVNAVACAAAVQRGMRERNADVPQERRIEYRIGVNLGDVIAEGDDIFGDGVNVVARLESIAPPGGIAVSATVRDHVGNRLDLRFVDMGARTLKNIEQPVHVYAVSLDAARDEPAFAPARQSAPEKPSVAVLPFANMSGDEEQRYFSDGITEDIITELARFRQLHVLARNSSFRYRGRDMDVVQVGRELGVGYLLEGSVRRLGGRVRITAQLIEAASGRHLWAERFDRSEEDIFAVQDKVVRTIVGTLIGRLQAAAAEVAKRKPPASLAAYEYVLKADALPFFDPAAETEARKLYRKAIEIDPDYARAYALLAINYYQEWDREIGASDALLDEALALARRSVALDENDGMCQSSLGLVYLNRKAFDLAEHHYRKAVELTPNSSPLLAAQGSCYGYLGDTERASGCFAEAKLLDPQFDPSWYWPAVGVVHFIARRYLDAIAALERSPVMPSWVHAYLAASCALTGVSDRAAAHVTELLRREPQASASRFAAKEPYRRESDRKHLIDGLRRAGLPE
jgi:TolB-like protein/class 3 adenylate cyclase/Tfp pilus assembly protein PilF